MKIRSLLAAISLVASLFIAAPAQAAPLAIGIAYDIGGRGDRSFNDAAAAGLEKAEKKFTFTVDTVVTDGTSPDRDRRIRSLISKNCNLIIAVGAGYAPTLKELAIEFPSTQFAILNDATIDALNVTSIIFADTQGAFLAGFSAAIASKSKRVAMIANNDQADIFQNGFLAGVLAAKRGVSASIRYVNGSSVTATRQAMNAGADVIFIARPGSDTEVFAAIVARNVAQSRQKNFRAVGMITVEPDQYVTVTASTKKYLYATVVKRVDLAMYDLIAKAIADEQHLDILDPKAGIYGHRYDINDGGVVLTTYLPALTAASAAINAAALQGSKIAN